MCLCFLRFAKRSGRNSLGRQMWKKDYFLKFHVVILNSIIKVFFPCQKKNGFGYGIRHAIYSYPYFKWLKHTSINRHPLLESRLTHKRDVVQGNNLWCSRHIHLSQGFYFSVAHFSPFISRWFPPLFLFLDFAWRLPVKENLFDSYDRTWYRKFYFCPPRRDYLSK